MDYLEKRIKSLSKKYKDKKFLLYGAGEYATEILSLYDFSSLNIIGITDKKFQQEELLFGYNAYPIKEAEQLEYDIILPLIKRPYLINLKKGKKVWLKKGTLKLKSGKKLHFCNILEEIYLRLIAFKNRKENMLKHIIARLDELNTIKYLMEEYKNEVKNEVKNELVEEFEKQKRINQIELSVFKTHQRTFPKYKNINNGKDVYIIATGPSLSKFEPTDENAIYIGVNKAFYSDKMKLDYLFIQDFNIGMDTVSSAIEYCKNNDTKFFIGRNNDDYYIPEQIEPFVENYYTDGYLVSQKSKFVLDIEANPLGDFHSITFAALQFALYTNPARIFLVGCDASINGYFYDNKFENFLYDDVFENWHLFREWSKRFYPQTKIISINPVRLSGLFDEDMGDIDYDSFLINNKMERMDANRDDIFEKTRCDFHLDRYKFACKYTEGKICIDCASGTGYGADILQKQGNAKEVYGLEINKGAFEYSQKFYSSDKVHFYNGSIFEIPFEDNKFDVFTSFETIEHVEDEEKQLSEVKRVLKPNGIFIVSTPNDWKSDTMNPYHVKQYDYYKLKETLEKHFEIVEIYNQNSGTPDRVENNDQPRQIIKTTEDNQHLAECFIAICKK